MATATITITDMEPSDIFGPQVSVIASCSDCDFKLWTGGSPDRDWSHVADDHLRQHDPDRAVDIEVDWEPVAYCSVCGNGLGDIHQEDDGLRCRDCGTTWDINGRNGERGEP